MFCQKNGKKFSKPVEMRNCFGKCMKMSMLSAMPLRFHFGEKSTMLSQNQKYVPLLVLYQYVEPINSVLQQKQPQRVIFFDGLLKRFWALSDTDFSLQGPDWWIGSHWACSLFFENRSSFKYCSLYASKKAGIFHCHKIMFGSIAMAISLVLLGLYNGAHGPLINQFYNFFKDNFKRARQWRWMARKRQESNKEQFSEYLCELELLLCSYFSYVYGPCGISSR